MAVLALVAVSFMVLSAINGGEAVTFTVQNKCTYTVWAAALPGGGKEVPSGQNWQFDVPAGTAHARIWGRTGCTIDGSGHGSCKTGDCGGQLSCQVSGATPATLAEYTLNGDTNTDTYDISLVDGFNVPMSMVPTKAGCQTTACTADVNALCPADQKTDGGCKSACVAFGTPQYCCTGDFEKNCPPTDKSKIFKNACPQAYSYAKDDQSSTFHCPSGGNYNIIFCG